MQTKNRLLLFFSFVASLTLSLGCEELRTRGANAVQVGLDCEAENVANVVKESGALMRQFILSTISGDGHVDSSALRAAARDLKDDGLRCAFAAAIAALSTSPSMKSADGQALLSSPQPIDGLALKGAFKTIAAEEWGITGAVLTRDGAL